MTTSACVTGLAAVLAVAMASACAGPDAGSPTSPPGSSSSISASIRASTDPSTPSPTSPGPTTTTRPASTPTGAAPLVLTATRSTLFDTARAFRLEVDGGDAPVVVRSLRLDSPLFDPVDAVDRDLVVAPQRRVLVPLPYGPADCTAPDDAGIGVVVGTVDGDVRVALDQHPDDLVTDLHRLECAVAAMVAAVDPRFGSDFTRTESRAAVGELVLSPPADGVAVDLVGMEGNIIFGLTTDAELPVTVDSDTVTVAVRMAANRCDSHALIEAKRKFFVPLTLVPAGGEPVVVEVEAAGATRDLFQQLLEACLDEPS